MLVLSRGPAEKIVFPNLGITVEVLRIQGNRVRVGINAPQNVAVLRHELDQARIDAALAERSGAGDGPSTHRQRNRLHTAQLALKLLQKQLEAGLTADSAKTLQKALREFDSLDEEFSPPEEVEAKVEAAPGSRRVLLVEDNVNESQLLSGYLRMSGYDVDTADNGLKALIYLSRHNPPDLLLLDMHMPEVDGPETVRSIRNNPELKPLKIFAVTGRSQEEMGVNLGPTGVDRWFRKPVNPEDLVHAMQRDLSISV